MAVDPTTAFIEDGMGTFTRPSAGGPPGPVIVTTTIAGMNTLATAGSLVPGQLYKVTDWVSGTGSLPGPNILWVEADDAHTPSKFVRVETPLGAAGPSDGEFVWNLFGSANIMTLLRDNLGNEIHGVAGTTIDAFVWGNATWTDNKIFGPCFASTHTENLAAATAGMTFANNVFVSSGDLHLAGCTGGAIASNYVGGGSLLRLTTGAGIADAVGNQLDSNAQLIVSAGGTATGCHVSAGAHLTTGAFDQVNVVVAGATTQTLTAANTNTYAGFGANTLV